MLAGLTRPFCLDAFIRVHRVFNGDENDTTELCGNPERRNVAEWILRTCLLEGGQHRAVADVFMLVFAKF